MDLSIIRVAQNADSAEYSRFCDGLMPKKIEVKRNESDIPEDEFLFVTPSIPGMGYKRV